MAFEEVLLGIAVRAAVSGSVRALRAQNTDVAEAAIDNTGKQFPDMELKPSLGRAASLVGRSSAIAVANGV